MKYKIFLLIVFLLLVPTIVFAEDQNNQTSSCSLFSPLNCLKDIAQLITYSTGLAAEPFLKSTAMVMTAQVYTEPFHNVWLAITGLISSFYIFFLLYSGIIFITQGDNIVKRHEAKESIKNVVIAIILVASSFYLYNILTDFNASITSYVFTQVNSNFFNVTSTSFGNAVFQIILIIPYVLLIMITLDLLFLRWLLVSLGIIFFPIGIFMYFVPFLRSYGKLILNLLILLIFIPFIISIIILGASTLVNTPMFTNFSIIFMTVSFLLIDFIFYLLVKFVMHKTAGSETVNYSKFVYNSGKNLFK